MKNLTITIVLLVTFASLQGCSASQTWYKPGGTQREFDIDSKECEIISKQQALFRSETGKRYSPVDYAEFYQKCIMANGWSTKPLNENETKPAAAQDKPLGSLEGNTLTVFDSRIVLPAGANLLKNTRQDIGPTRMESFLLQDGEYFLNIILQDSEEAFFQKIPYPVEKPYQLYTSNSKNNIRWSAFWGNPDDEWVKGIGSFLQFSRHRRCIIIVTGPLSPPSGSPPEGLLLSENQNQEMLTFVDRWRPWLEKQSCPEPLAWRAFRKTLGMFKSF